MKRPTLNNSARPSLARSQWQDIPYPLEHGASRETNANILFYLQSFEHVLANINKLNRSLEAVTAVRTIRCYAVLGIKLMGVNRSETNSPRSKRCGHSLRMSWAKIAMARARRNRLIRRSSMMMLEKGIRRWSMRVRDGEVWWRLLVYTPWIMNERIILISGTNNKDVDDAGN